MTLGDGPAQISRENISRRISVEANVRGRDLGSFIAAAQTAVRDEVELPSGWSLDWGGQFENLQSASRRLALLVPLSLLLIFLLLYTTFSSARLAVLDLPQRAVGDQRGHCGARPEGLPVRSPPGWASSLSSASRC